MQRYSLIPSEHTPAFKHGLDKHSLMPSLHWIPVQPGAHTQLHPVALEIHVPNEHGPLLHGDIVVSQSLPTNRQKNLNYSLYFNLFYQYVPVDMYNYNYSL